MSACSFRIQPSLFERGGIKDAHTRNLATGGVGVVLFVFSWIPIFYFDRLGRRTWLQIGTVGMMGAMVGSKLDSVPLHAIPYLLG